MNRGTTVLLMAVLVFISCAEKQVVKPEEPVAEIPPVEELKLPDIPLPSGEEAEEEKKEEMNEEPPTKVKPEEKYVMLNFENADLSTVITTMSEMLKINYILAPGVSGRVTIQSHKKIPLSELFSTFQQLLEFNGFTAVKEGSFYRIVPLNTARQQPVPVEVGPEYTVPGDAGFVTQRIPLQYVQANKVVTIIQNLMPLGTDIIPYEPSNVLIVTAPPSGIIKLLKLLEIIDIPDIDRDSIRTFVYHVENAEANKLAAILKKIYAEEEEQPPPPARATTPAPAPRTTLRRPRTQPSPTPAQEGLPGEVQGEVMLIEAYEDINALLIKATPRGYLSLLESIKKLDIQPKQVLIEVLIAEITLDDETKFGIEWLLRESGTVTVGNLGGSIEITEEGVTTVLPTNFFANIVDPDGFRMLISAAATSDRFHVLASPHVLALDNKEAKIEIANEVPVATSISQPQSVTANVISQVQFKSAGVILTVTPHISEKKQVTLKLVQEVSELGETVPIAGEEYQGFITRKANTTAIVQDGHTLVFGGIISERIQKTRSGIPVLSKIPILGYLFGTTTDDASRRELILMVTPHVVSSHEEADLLTEEYKSRIRSVKRQIEKRERRIRRDMRSEVEERQRGVQADVHIHDEDNRGDDSQENK